MTNEERKQEQAASNPYAAGGQPPYPPSPGTPPPSYPYTPAPTPPQPYYQPIMESAPQGYSPTPPPYPPMQQQPYPPYMGGGEAAQTYVPSPPYPYTPPVAPRKSNRGLIILLIVLAVIVVLGASGGVLIYTLTRPQPVITVTSNYAVSTVPAGSTGTTFRVRGQKFSGSEAITFLLDGVPAPGSQAAYSDKDGNITTDLTVDANWTPGNHTITAKDADGYTTQTGSKITIVPQGEAHTPGPNGAPPDDTTGMVLATITLNQTGSETRRLTISGLPDPQGGTVCGDGDNNKPITDIQTKNGITATVILTRTCSGTYKAGRLSLTETVTSATFTLTNNGVTANCPATVPYVSLRLDGTFTNATTIIGSASSDKFTVNCDQGVGAVTVDADSGTWTGTIQQQTGNSNV